MNGLKNQYKINFTMNIKLLEAAIKRDGGVFQGLPNYTKIRIKQLDQSDESFKYFNALFFELRDSDMRHIEWSNSGGISTKGRNSYASQWGIKAWTWAVELTLILWIGDSKWGCRWQFGRGEIKLEEKELDYSGRRALFKAKADAKRFGIDLDSLAVKNGKEIKNSIESPIIWVDERQCYKTLENAHHIDFRSSHCAGAIEAFPVLEPMIRHWFSMRKKNPIYKAQLVMFWGAMQSPVLCQAKWANISKAGIEWTNKHVLEMRDKLIKSGRKVIAINTDGVWYLGDIYHGENEGDDIGNWHNDHINCKLRYKSRGCYEYIEDGKYYPVLRGKTNLDTIKPRSSWTWGDIFSRDAEPNYFEFTYSEGLRIISEERRQRYLLEEEIKYRIDKKIKN